VAKSRGTRIGRSTHAIRYVLVWSCGKSRSSTCQSRSKALQCIYAITKRVVLAVDEEQIPEGIELLDIVLERQLSYFSDLEGVNGLIRYLGDSPWAQFIGMVAADFNAANPRRPFALWQDIDSDFKDLIVQMMNVDPTQRLTADEALAHRWFSDVPG
jgi:serine/threonine protein kinase